MNSTFNPTCVDNGSVNVCVYITTCLLTGNLCIHIHGEPYEVTFLCERISFVITKKLLTYFKEFQHWYIVQDLRVLWQWLGRLLPFGI